MQKKLYKSSKEKMISGVAGGIAEYFEIDPVFVRLLFVLLAFFNGIGLIAYIVCAIVMPKEPTSDVVVASAVTQENEPSSTEKKEVKVEEKTINKNEKRNRTIGIILIIIGVILLANEILPTFEFEEILPILFIIFGLWLLLNSFSKNSSTQSKMNNSTTKEEL